jgi:hypothetical protein
VLPSTDYASYNQYRYILYNEYAMRANEIESDGATLYEPTNRPSGTIIFAEKHELRGGRKSPLCCFHMRNKYVIALQGKCEPGRRIAGGLCYRILLAKLYMSTKGPWASVINMCTRADRDVAGKSCCSSSYKQMEAARSHQKPSATCTIE